MNLIDSQQLALILLIKKIKECTLLVQKCFPFSFEKGLLELCFCRSSKQKTQIKKNYNTCRYTNVSRIERH